MFKNHCVPHLICCWWHGAPGPIILALEGRCMTLVQGAGSLCPACALSQSRSLRGMSACLGGSRGSRHCHWALQPWAQLLVSGWAATSLWECTEYQGVSVYPLMVSVHHCDWWFSAVGLHIRVLLLGYWTPSFTPILIYTLSMRGTTNYTLGCQKCHESLNEWALSILSQDTLGGHLALQNQKKQVSNTLSVVSHCWWAPEPCHATPLEKN